MAYCNNCGNQLDEAVNFCRSCGDLVSHQEQPSSKGTLRGCFKWTGIGCGGLIGLFTILIIVAGIFGGGDGETETASSVAVPRSTHIPAPTPSPVLTFTITQLKQEYDANQIAADQHYKGKAMRVSGGTIENISRDILGSPYVSVGVNKDFDFWSLTCRFSQDDQVVELKRGQRVTIQGTNDGMSLGIVEFKNCMIETRGSQDVGNGAESGGTPSIKEAIEPGLNATELLRDLDDTRAFLNKYGGRVVEVTGFVVKNVAYGGDPENSYSVWLSNLPDTNLNGIIKCLILDLDPTEIEQFRVNLTGHTLTARGTIVEVRDGWIVVMEDCSIVPVIPRLESLESARASADIELTVAQLIAESTGDFVADPPGLNKDVVGKVALIAGIVGTHGSQERISGGGVIRNQTLSLVAAPGGWVVQCRFPPWSTDNPVLDKIEVGQSATVKGVISRRYLSIIIVEECSMVSQ